MTSQARSATRSPSRQIAIHRPSSVSKPLLDNRSSITSHGPDSVHLLHSRHECFSARTPKSQDAATEPSYASQADMEIALSEIRLAVGSEYVSTDADELHNHGYSDWSSINSDQLPVAIAKICHKYRVPIVPYSGGSSLEGNFSYPFGGLSLGFAHMDQILVLQAEDMDVVVQPSVPWMSLNEEIKESVIFFRRRRQHLRG